MEKNKICRDCTDKHCCHGMCKEMFEYLNKANKEEKKDDIE